MHTSTLANSLVATIAAATLLAGCTASSSSLVPPNASSNVAATGGRFTLPPHPARPASRVERDDLCAGNAIYFSDYDNSVIDSFGATGGSSACTVTPGGLSNPMGIWVQPVAGTYHNYLFAANSGNGTAVAFKTPLHSTSKPVWQFNAGGSPSDVVQDQFGNVYVAVYGTEKIDVFTPPFSSCAYPNGCAPSYVITDPCGSVYWLATDGKGDVYSNNYCGYVTLFITPITAGEVGTPMTGVGYVSPGGMIVDRHNRLVVNDPSSQKIAVYRLNVESAQATFAFGLAPYTGAIFGIGLDKTDSFLWGANAPATAGQRFTYASGGTGGTPSATDPTLVLPLGAAVRPASPE